MKQHLPRSRKQSGIALIALLVLTVLAAGYAFYRSTNIGTVAHLTWVEELPLPLLWHLEQFRLE